MVTLDSAAIASLIEMLGGDTEALAEIADEFLVEAPQRIAEINTGTASGDAILAQRGAHTLKANALTFGANALADVSRRVEEAAGAGDLATAASLTDTVSAEWFAVESALRSLCRRPPP